MSERERLDKAVKCLLLGPCKSGYEIKIRCRDRSYSMRGEIDWSWLSGQQGKIDLTFRVDSTQPPLDMATIVIFERQVLRRRKRWGILQTTKSSCNIIQPSKMTAKWLETLKGEDFNLMLRTHTDAAASYKTDQARLLKRQSRTDFRMKKYPESAIASSVLEVPTNTEATLRKGFKELRCCSSPALHPALLSPIKTPPALKSFYELQHTPPKPTLTKFLFPDEDPTNEVEYSPAVHLHQTQTPGKNLPNHAPMRFPVTNIMTTTHIDLFENVSSVQPPTPGKFPKQPDLKKKKPERLRRRLRELFGDSDSD